VNRTCPHAVEAIDAEIGRREVPMGRIRVVACAAVALLAADPRALGSVARIDAVTRRRPR
jgi:hypothetical protein